MTADKVLMIDGLSYAIDNKAFQFAADEIPEVPYHWVLIGVGVLTGYRQDAAAVDENESFEAAIASISFGEYSSIGVSGYVYRNSSAASFPFPAAQITRIASDDYDRGSIRQERLKIDWLNALTEEQETLLASATNLRLSVNIEPIGTYVSASPNSDDTDYVWNYPEVDIICNSTVCFTGDYFDDEVLDIDLLFSPSLMSTGAFIEISDSIASTWTKEPPAGNSKSSFYQCGVRVTTVDAVDGNDYRGYIYGYVPE